MIHIPGIGIGVGKGSRPIAFCAYGPKVGMGWLLNGMWYTIAFIAREDWHRWYSYFWTTVLT